MGRLVSLGVILPALLLTVSGCATKDWVNELLGKKEAQIDNRFRTVDAAVGEASSGARQAGTRADAAQTALLTVVKELKENPALTVDLEGYTDPVGTRGYNIGLSQRRVEAVRRYLIQSGAELPRITAIGLGQVNGPGRDEEHSKQRRVTVRLMTPID